LPKLVYDVNEAESRLVRLPLASIAKQLQSTLEGSLGGSILEGNEEIPVRVRLADEDRRELTGIENVNFLSDVGGVSRPSISLSTLGTPVFKAESDVIARFNGVRINEVRAFLTAGVLPSTVLAAVETDLKRPEYLPPAGCSIEFGGESSKRTEALSQLLGNVSMLAAGIVFVLVFSLKSFRAMAIILAIGVLSFGMAILSLWATDFAFGFTAIVGAMGMIGIAINDSIVVLAELRADEQCHQGNLKAIVEMVMRSTRHVLCTTFTVGCSFVPMLLEGGTFWPPMAMVISGGVFGATLLALYWIPAMHILLAGKQRPSTTLAM
jgi:multidrug efflux pump subunit AcrB